MANTIMSAKNSFQEGLIMDFSPDNTQATCMTSALNATLLTFNGNEMLLLNDMGNGRVETAFLPEGYIPVGTCEFGDIIYIVSYNPIINKSLIGCFPSPERNISTEEIGGLGETLSASDFLEIKGGQPTGKLKTSSVKKILYDNRDMTSGDKYIIYSGDLENINNYLYLSDYGNTHHEHGTFPKLVKIHVVSIEDSGKIVYLDSTTKWYDNDYYISNKVKKENIDKVDIDSYRDLLNSGYSIFSSKISGKLALLVELEKVTGFSCAWEAYANEVKTDNTNYDTNYTIYFHYNWSTNHNDINPDGVSLLTSEWSKINNTLGLYQKWSYNNKTFTLGEFKNLEIDLPKTTINSRYLGKSLSRHYEPENMGYTEYKDNKYDTQIKKYLGDFKLNIDMQDGMPNPGHYYINCTKIDNGSYYNGNLKIEKPEEIKDSIVNNYFHYPIIKKFYTFSIPTKLEFNVNNLKIFKYPNINNLIYHYKIAPTMPYGILEEYAQEGYIDFSKLGKQNINLNTWKYYNYENTSTLTWGMEAYTEPNKGIQEVIFEFYDNQGFVAAYHTKDKLSYNGVFTEYLTLNESGANYKLNNIKAFDTEPTYHKGLEVTKETAVPGFKYLHKDGGDWIDFDDLGKGQYYMDDSGILYSNCLYLVKIIVKYGNKNTFGEYIDISKEKAIIDYRWYWTNNMFNEHYYQVKDFKNIQANLTLDCSTVFKQADNYSVKTDKYIVKDDYTLEINNSNYWKSLSATVLSVNLDNSQSGNVKMSVEAGLLNNYNTFNINLETKGLISVDIYLTNDRVNNFPELPLYQYTSDNINILSSFPLLYPSFDINDGKISDSTSTTFKNILNVPLNNKEGKELWELENPTTEYANDFNITLDNGNKGGAEFSYINSYTGLIDTTTNYQYLSLPLSACDSVDLTFTGVHLSKYCYLNKKSDNLPVLKAFVADEKDLETYNLAINNQTKKLYFNKILMTSMSDAAGDDSFLLLNILQFSDSGFGYNCLNILNLTNINVKNYGKDGDGDLDVHIGLQENKESLLNNFKFLFPIGYGYRKNFDGHSGHSSGEAKVNNNHRISTNKEISRSSYGDGDLGGTIAGISTGGFVDMGDHHSTTNMLTSYVPLILSYLTLLFYLTEQESVLYSPHNYIFLSDNYTEYSKDVVLKLSTNNSSNLLLLKGFEYTKYLDDIYNHVFKKNYPGNDPNVDIIINSCLKTFPLKFRFNYIKPEEIDINLIILIKSIFKEIPLESTDSYLKDVIYYWNGQTFESYRGLTKLKNILSYSIDNQSKLTASLSNNLSEISIGSIGTSLLLEIGPDNTLMFKTLPTGKGSYFVQTGKRSLRNYISGLKYF